MQTRRHPRAGIPTPPTERERSARVRRRGGITDAADYVDLVVIALPAAARDGNVVVIADAASACGDGGCERGQHNRQAQRKHGEAFEPAAGAWG